MDRSRRGGNSGDVEENAKPNKSVQTARRKVLYKLHQRKSKMWTDEAVLELQEKGSALIGGGKLGLVHIQKELEGSWVLQRFKPEQVHMRVVHERNTKKEEQGKKRKKNKDK